MAKKMCNIFNLSLSVRKLIAVSNNGIKPIQLYCTASQYRTTLGKNHAAQHKSSDVQPFVPKKYSLVMSKLHDCVSQNQVLHLINETKAKMNVHEALKVLATLFVIDKKAHDASLNITKTIEFSKLCEIIKFNIRDLSNAEAIDALKVLNYFHISTSTVIMQMLLRTISNSVNDLSLSQLLFVNFLISKCEKTPIIEALSIALPIVLESHIKYQLDTENIDNLISLYHYYMRKPITVKNNKSLFIIINALNKIDISLVSFKHAYKLINSLNDYNHDIVIDLAKNYQQIILKSIDDISSKDLNALINLLSLKYKYCNDLYDESLIDACVTAVVSKDMGFNTAVNVLRCCNKIGYISNYLLDYVAAKCFEGNSVVNHNSRKILIDSLSKADYKPVFWETLKNLLLTDDLLYNSSSTLINLALYLASLDCYWPPLLAKTFTLNCNAVDLSFSSLRRLLLLYKIVKINHPEYDGPWPSNESIRKCESVPDVHKHSDSLKLALECALGGPQYVLSNLKSSINNVINNVVIMRKGGFPIAINNVDESIPSKIEELKPPPDSQVILFMYIPDSTPGHHSHRITGLWSLLIRTLQLQTNYTVIPIHNHMWQTLTESEQVQYISQAIRLRCDELSAVINS